MTYLAKYKRVPQARLVLGSVLMSPGARQNLSWGDVHRALERHVSGDWGDISPENWEGNNFALAKGMLVSSSYKGRSGVKFRVITDCDTHLTKIIMPDEAVDF
ncbi:MAG: hypothetical protein HPY50_19860 [Firmicutes bacterium]|nr:hypothetical protein [Bacillota bacterium]